ncbi:MAG TPA: GMC family oxidoreductase N-terminal domain-containing protein [Solirubrobacteraceae bacterium]|jgi:choline dehydrogenase|nr:GMC family oxidoreductase N-terminal domain-containing protein [Solirubrobacteraceae bacterium]
MSHVVIVGAGSGGGALAARLTENPDYEVTLVEAGPDFPRDEEVPDSVRYAYEMSVDEHDWGLRAYFLEPPEAREPQPYPRGRLVGGSSSVNAAMGARATAADMRSWVDCGNTEWSYEKVLPYFRRLENDRDYGDTAEHGQDGPVSIMRYREDQWSDAARAFAASCIDRRFPVCEDMNAWDAVGVGSVPRNLTGDARESSLLTYLRAARGRPNLKLISDAACRRVLFEGTRAVGVEIDLDGKVRQIAGDHIVLAAGAIHTPQLLMLSGVGPHETLDRFGIPVVCARGGVGRNFQDHPFVPLVALLSRRSDVVGARNGLRYTSTLGKELGLVNDMMVIPSQFDPATMNMDIDAGGRQAITLVSLLARPRSRGWVTLASADPREAPEIHVNFLSDPADEPRLEECVRLAHEIATSSPFKDEIDEILFPDAATVDDPVGLKAFIRGTANTAYHGSCSCRIGPSDDAAAVVDQRLSVQGVENLWIGDASVMVSVPTALTNITAYMIGERLADLLREAMN